MISSYNIYIIERLRDRNADLVTALLSGQEHVVDRAILIACKAGATALHVPMRLATKQLIDRAREQSLLTAVHTVNELADMSRVTAMGFDGVFTNYPSRLRQLIQNTRHITEPTAWAQHLSLAP